MTVDNILTDALPAVGEKVCETVNKGNSMGHTSIHGDCILCNLNGQVYSYVDMGLCGEPLSAAVNILPKWLVPMEYWSKHKMDAWKACNYLTGAICG